MKKIEILDKHFIAMPKARKTFVVSIGLGYFLIALIAYIYNLVNAVEGMLILVIGILYTEIIKLNYRIEKLEK